MANILEKYLKTYKIKQKEFAKLIKVSAVMVHYIIKGKKTPSLKTALKIEQATNGEVSVQKLAKGVK